MSSLRDRIAAKRDAIAASRAGGTKTYKFKVGTTMIRILPDTKSAEGDAWREYGQHFIKDENDNLLAVIGDRSIVSGGTETCPVRDALLAAAKTAPKDLKDHIYKKVLAKMNNLMNIVVLGQVTKDKKLVQDPEAPPSEVQLLSLSQNQLDDILSIFEIYIDNDEDPFDLNNGITLMVERTGMTATDTRYKYNAYPKKMPISAEVFAKANDLDAWIASTFKEGAAKALAAVGQITGTIAGPIGEAAKALTESKVEKPALVESVVDDAIDLTNGDDGTIIEDAEFEVVDTELVTEVKTPAKTNPTKTETVAAADDDDILSILDGLGG